MKLSCNLRTLLHTLRYTPIHPQWFAYLCERKRYEHVGNIANGRIIDIGCGRQPLRKFLKSSVTYFSLDLPETGILLYNTNPSVLGDAGRLPFSNATFDTVILLEVLEHLPDSKAAIQEARRILKKGGILVLSTPFLYPIHDAPRDYQRWTRHGLEQLLSKEGLGIKTSYLIGSPCETGVLLFNLSLAWTTLNGSLIARLPLLMLSIIFIPFLNLLGYAIARLCKTRADSPFAIGYLLVAQELEK